VDASTPAGASGAHEGEYIAIATVGKPVGLEGWCRIFPYGNTLKNITPPCDLMAGNEVPETRVNLIELRKVPKRYQGRFEKYNSRDSIDSLKNSQLFIGKDMLPEVQHDEFYHFELEEMDVISNTTKEYFGKVAKVHNYPTVDALEVEKKSGYTFILPLTKEIVTKIDKTNRKIYVSDSALEELL
jgi:16S rRNA processing protein RimM